MPRFIQVAIEDDVVGLADDDHLGPGIAGLRQLLELGDQVGRAERMRLAER